MSAPPDFRFYYLHNFVRAIEWIGARPDDLLSPLEHDFNLHQDWSEFVLSDLGIFHYERVTFWPASRVFQHL